MFQTKQCVQQCLMKTLIGLFMKTRVCLVKHLLKCLVKILSKICVYSIIPTFSTSSDFHTYWVLIFHFYSQHGVFCPKNRTDLLWNYFLYLRKHGLRNLLWLRSFCCSFHKSYKSLS